MLKAIRFEIIIIGILFINIVITHSFNINFYNYVSYLKNDLLEINLVKFFTNITTLGDSLWYFLISIVSLIICYSLIKSNILKKYENRIIKIQYFSFLLFSSVLSSGILTQLIKHVVGRPRPGVLNLENEYGLKFITFDSNFHSFPSGHATTIFAAVLAISFVAPRLKYFLYLSAIIISFSRIVVGAHFVTDLVGGAAVAFIGFKFSKLILYKIFNKNKTEGLPYIVNDSFKLIIFIFLTFSLFLTVGPTFDIFFSKLFHNENGGFLLQRYYFNLEIFNYSRGTNPTILFRKLFLPAILFYIFILPFISNKLFFQQLYFGHIFKLKEIVFLWLTSLIGLVFIINLGFKNFWGRSRPNDIISFGGFENFTPWYQITDQCINNCSFVSGDSSVGFALIVFYFLVKKKIYLWIALIIGISLGMIRIMEGGHFISDIVFSGIIIFIYYSLCHNFFHKKI